MKQSDGIILVGQYKARMLRTICNKAKQANLDFNLWNIADGTSQGEIARILRNISRSFK